jgi:acylphosphatase
LDHTGNDGAAISVTEGTVRQRRETQYAGQVQGVGFRFQTLRIARGYDVVGFVRNLPDGRVQLVAEGAKQDLDRFLAEVAESMSGYIRRCTSTTSAATGEFDAFVVRS